MQFRPGPPMHGMPAFPRPPFMNGSLAMPPGMPPPHLMRPPLMMPPPVGPVVLTPPGSNPSPAPAQKSTTLYVGKIASSVSDETIQTLLTACGPVKSWKPMQDPETNKSKGFGFCEYENAEGVLRALRLLHNLSLDGQELLLKCNTATQRYIDDYQTSKQRQAERKKQEASQPDGDAEVKAEAETEETDDQQDDAILAKIMALVSDRAAQQAGSIAADQATDLLNDILPPPPSRDRRSLGRDQLSASKERTHSSRERERGTSTDRNAERQLERERQREKREVEMRQAEQERAYQKRLKEWEHTERLREKAIEKERADRKAAEKDRIKLIRTDNEIGDEDEDDEPWARKAIHTSRHAESRRRKRKEEARQDAVDQEAEEAERATAHQKQQEEVRLRADEEAARSDSEENDQDMANGAEEEVDPNDPIYQAMMAAAQAPPRSVSPYQQYPSPSPLTTADTLPPDSTAGRPGAAPPAKGGWHTVFGGDEDQDAPQRRLIPLNYSEEEQKAAQAAAAATAAPVVAAPVINKDEEIEKLKKQIPRSMQTLATTAINWDAYNAGQPKIGQKVGKWVSGQIERLLGQQEATLLNFVQGELNKHSTPNALLNELDPILDLEAEEFVLKLYQIVVFESSKFALLGHI